MKPHAITLLQCAVLRHIGSAGRTRGTVTRDWLAANGHKQSAPAFYQLMARLGQMGLVGAEEVKDGRYYHTVYSLTPEGKAALRYAGKLLAHRFLGT